MLTQDERGPAGTWCYETRTLLGLSVEQVIDRLPTRYHPATLRKAEGSGAKPSRQLYRELRALYEATARTKGIAIAAQPALNATADPASSDLTAAIREAGALHAAAIDRQTAVMAELVEELRKLAWANVDLHQEVGEVLGRVRVFPSPATFRSDAPEQDWPGSPPAAPPESRGSR